ncbi:MAG: zonular occludens toxin domain-containing protein [Gallionella sp.]|nr:zonular occludens toxin domain-containing protein [Gallionella sp.]
MSDAILLAGKRGSGKGLGGLHLISRALGDGRAVATNMNLFVEHLVPAYNRTKWYRVPDFPSSEDLEHLPLGNPRIEWVEGEADPQLMSGFKESENGLLVLDEAGNFLSAREWNGKDRQKLVNWLSQSRKYGWDLCFMSQHVGMVDKQVRDALIEVQGTVKRTDKIAVPLFSPIWKYFTGRTLTFPRWHVVALRYGFDNAAPLSERFIYRGTEFYKAYNTLQKIHPETGQKGTSSMLSAYDVKGRYMNKWDLRRQMAAGGVVLGLLLGFGGGYMAHAYKPGKVAEIPEVVESAVKVRGVIKDGSGRDLILLTDGRSLVSTTSKADSKGVRYLVGTTWYGS